MKTVKKLSKMLACVVLATIALAAAWETAAAAPGGDGAQDSQPPATSPGAPRRQGSLLWEDRYDPTTYEQAYMTAADKGRTFAVGYLLGYGRDALVRAYETKTGRLLWEDRVNRGVDDFASGVVTDGRLVYVSGMSVLPGHGSDWTLRAYEAETGAVVWDTTWDLAGGSDVPRGTAIAVSNGRVFLGGFATNRAGNTDWVVRAYDASDGALLWHDQRDMAGDTDGAHTLAADNDAVYAGGSGYRGSTATTVLRALDARDGSVLWEDASRTGRAGNTFVRRVKVAGGRVFAGILQQDSATGLVKSVIAAYGPGDGTQLWEGALNPSPRNVLEDLHASDGYVVATGQGGAACVNNSPTSDCAAVVRVFDAGRGALRWSSDLQLSPVDDVALMVTGEGGKVFVLGQQAATYTLQGVGKVGRWVMHGFDAMSGEMLWRSVGGPLESGVYNTVVDGGILITPGRAVDERSTFWDFLVRAYDTRGAEGAIEPLPFVPLPEVSGAGTDGRATFDVSSPQDITTVPYGLVPATAESANVIDDPTDNYVTARRTGVGATFHKITAPAGTRHLRVSLFDEETDGNDDLDLFVFTPNGGVYSSASFMSKERVDVASPAPGVYTVMVHGYATDGPDANYTLFSWAVPPATAGNFNVSGPPAGGTGTVTVDWFGLTAGVRYMGDIAYHGAGGEVGHTFVTVGPGPQTSLAVYGFGGQQSEPAPGACGTKAGAGAAVLDDCAGAEYGPQGLPFAEGESQIEHLPLPH